MTLSRFRTPLLCIATSLVLASVAACAPAFSRADPEEVRKLATDHAIQFEGHPLHFLESGTPGKPLVVLIHGTPGSWEAFSGFLTDETLRAHTHMIALDRPGFGGSDAVGPMPAFKDQARAVQALFARGQANTRVVLVGHSLGGSIAYRVAGDFPSEVGGVLAISSALDPSLIKPRWYNHAANLWLVRWLLPQALKTSNAEMMPLQSELAAIVPQLGGLTMPVTVIQGGQDGLVDERHVDFVEHTLAHAPVRALRYPDDGHFIIWEQPQLIVAEILRLVDTMEPITSGIVQGVGQSDIVEQTQ